MLNLMSFSPSNFGRYVSQTEGFVNESNGINEWTQQQPPSSTSTINDIPSLISISTTPPPIIPTNVSQKIIIPSPVIKDDVEPLRFPQHGPGPIQRPNKLACPPSQQLTSSYLTNSIQSPGTPDVLDQISRLLDHQNNTTTVTTPVPTTSNMDNSSIPMNDLSTPNIPWTTFSPTEWPSKYDSSWPLTNIQSPTVPLTTQVQNPFALMATINEQQRQPTREEASVWSSVLGTATPRFTSSSARTQRASTWNEVFQSTVPSSTDSTKPTANNSWFKFWSAPDPSSADVTLPNGHETETNPPFWSLGTLSNEPVIPSTISNQQQASSSAWWSNSSSDENNNKSQTNHSNNDVTNNLDQSRWDFAR
jgi:hypothetical protein